MTAAIVAEQVAEKSKDNPRGAGRTPRAGEPASAHVAIRLTAAEHEAYRTAATEADIPLAEWIRQQCNKTIARRTLVGGITGNVKATGTVLLGNMFLPATPLVKQMQTEAILDHAKAAKKRRRR